MGLKDDFQKLINDYSEIYKSVNETQNYKHPFSDIIRHSIPEEIASEIQLPTDRYKVKGSCGAGRWTGVPWIAIFDKRITTGAQRGIYIVYLLNKDTKTLYLTLNQGATSVAQNSNDKSELEFTGIAKANNGDTIKRLRNNVAAIRKAMGEQNSELLNSINSGSPGYDAGCIYSKTYKLNTLPEDDQLFEDLKEFVDLYDAYFDKVFVSEKRMQIVKSEKADGDMDIKQVIDQASKYITSKGFSYPEGLIENFCLCLKSKPFVILAGTSGTGKTKLVRLFAEAVGATSENGRYKLVPVRPDWSDSSDLFGHVDLNGKFISGAITDFIASAEKVTNLPYFLCLDEMNLARVEYYLSDILSVIETRTRKNDKIKTDKISIDGYGELYLPENLYIIGTVNMDETTFPFSKKVLDRANTIEFSYVDLAPKFDEISSESAHAVDVGNSVLKTEYLILNECPDTEHELVVEYCEWLADINEILKKANANIGYRVRDEIVFYMLNNKAFDLLDENIAFDNEILQKILPRIQGSSSSVKEMVCELFHYCAGDYPGYKTDLGEQSDGMLKKLNSDDSIKYPRSAEKLAYMMRRYEEDGFTSYWL